jgi:hypothetical protein
MHLHSVGHHHHPNLPVTADISGIPDALGAIGSRVASVHVRVLAPPRNGELQREDVYFLDLGLTDESTLMCHWITIPASLLYMA